MSNSTRPAQTQHDGTTVANKNSNNSTGGFKMPNHQVLKQSNRDPSQSKNSNSVRFGNKNGHNQTADSAKVVEKFKMVTKSEEPNGLFGGTTVVSTTVMVTRSQQQASKPRLSPNTGKKHTASQNHSGQNKIKTIKDHDASKNHSSPQNGPPKKTIPAESNVNGNSSKPSDAHPANSRMENKNAGSIKDSNLSKAPEKHRKPKNNRASHQSSKPQKTVTYDLTSTTEKLRYNHRFGQPTDLTNPANQTTLNTFPKTISSNDPSQNKGLMLIDPMKNLQISQPHSASMIHITNLFNDSISKCVLPQLAQIHNNQATGSKGSIKVEFSRKTTVKSTKK